MWNRCVFGRDLKEETVSEVQMSSGREFQRLEVDWQKALDPMVVRLADGVKSWRIGGCWRVCEYGSVQRDMMVPGYEGS